MKQPVLPLAKHDDVPPSTRSWVLLAVLLMLLLTTAAARAQAPVILTVGTGGDAPTLTQALQSLPQPLPAPYELRLLNETFTENVTISEAFTATNFLTIKPASGASPVVEGTLTFSGSTHVVVDGNNGTSARALTLRQPATSQPTVVLQNDAQYITVRDAKVLGSNAVAASGVVVLGNGIATGNDNNVLQNNLISNLDATQLPVNLVYAANAVATAANDQNTLYKNDLANFSGAGMAVLAGNGSSWSITDNNIYSTLTTPPTTAQVAIQFLPGVTSTGNTISSNFIGGKAAGATGGSWENKGDQDFVGIQLQCGTGNTVSNNTVRNVSLSYAGVANNEAFMAIWAATGQYAMSGNVVTGITNSGTGGINCLVSQANITLSTYTVASGQIMSIEGGQLYVPGNLTTSVSAIFNHTGGNILIDGGFTNKGTFAQTLGDLEVKGDMINLNIFNCTTGAVKLTGNGPQKVSGGTYFNLEINGTGTKTLTDDMTVYNGIQMLQGILNTSTYLIRIGPLANLAETENSYIVGKVKAANRLPEEGLTEDFGNIGLTLTPAVGSTLPGIVSVTRTTGVSTANNILRYFDVEAETATGLNADMSIKYFTHELGSLSASQLQFYYSPDGSTWQQRGLSSSAANQATLLGVSNLARWSLGKAAIILPVHLTEFRAVRSGADARLSWTTATEQNARGFGVEMSLDGKAYRPLSFVAAGNRAGGQQYGFVDQEAGKAGVRYYRLRQEDQNGNVTYSTPRSVVFNALSLSAAAYPSPFAEQLTLDVVAPQAAVATVRLVDALGRTVWSRRQPLEVGTNHFSLLPSCASGTYLLVTEVEGQVLRQRVQRR